jgi:hypothetical protein
VIDEIGRCYINANDAFVIDIQTFKRVPSPSSVSALLATANLNALLAS